MRPELPTTNKALQSDIELAREAAKRRLTAPPVTEHSVMKLRRKELIETYAPDCVNKYHREGRMVKTEYAPNHPCWIEKKTYREWLAKGYEPVVNQGMVLEDEGDILMKCPRELYLEGLQGPSLRAKMRMREKDNTSKAIPGAVEETLGAITAGEAESIASEAT